MCGSLLAQTRTSCSGVLKTGSVARCCTASIVVAGSWIVCIRRPVSTSQTMIFLSAPPLMRRSLPETRAVMTLLTKSEWPLYLRLGCVDSISQDHMSLSHDPAKMVLLWAPPTARHVTGARGPRYVLVTSEDYAAGSGGILERCFVGVCIRYILQGSRDERNLRTRQ